ncbi:LOW QUALITY PROTEIN: uncharacterized protein LOC133626016 [Colius striatus]|uniref:LOW QUALITY PROTEIN: uncharacterized protein LOC133625930 n=1 Tax=Colius striatus TaxID=57412 RepID=UPI002B1E3336|nr:LOW QUALITY PROTEIN: uncharacterized protein LOC133625930 [Colius striatus]XP_061857642.1 LOW QUALITY PROTEIN: uncharacterized protein LOC133625969 [Colius striatus]XP_061857978.1 LOW QUALITY PROTEIN: uncharacterized protein LOC133626016 [Colius striatus]
MKLEKGLENNLVHCCLTSNVSAGTNCTTQLGAVCKLAESAFDSSVYVTEEEGRYYWSRLSENYYFQRGPLGLRQCGTTIKGSPTLCSPIHFSRLLLLGSQVHLLPTDMSCCSPCQPCGPTPLANSCTEPCCLQCQSSTVVIEPSPVVVTLPGPILSSFPQNTVVGSSTSAAAGSILSSQGVPISSGGFDLSCLTRGYCGSRCRPC